MLRALREKVARSIAESRARLVDLDSLDSTVERLRTDGEISMHGAISIRSILRRQLDGSRYVLNHLGAHVAIGVVFAFDVVPLPLGTISRLSWVAGSRVVESARRRPEQARVHSLGVFAIAAIPWVGYSAYLLPLRRRSTELAFVLANHTWLARTGQTYEHFLAHTRSPVRRLGRWLVPLPESLSAHA